MDALEVFRCPLCLEYAESAVSTSCCFQVYCKGCLSSIPPPSYCPSCRSNNKKVGYTEAVAVQRALDTIDVQCPNNCSTTPLKRGNLKTHLSTTCIKRLIKCPCPTCNAPMMTPDALGIHIATVHGEILVSRAARIFEEQTSTTTTNTTRAIETADQRLDNIINMNWLPSRLGANGMRYCGGNLPKPGCGCCNGKCGITSGCACVACMVLEINLRKLPPGWLVNREGASCRKGVTGLIYCGRNKQVPRSDGWCGPTDGPQCNACRTLQHLSTSWYKDIESLRN